MATLANIEQRIAAKRAAQAAANATTQDIATNTLTSSDKVGSASKVPKGDIVTLLDLTNRDLQESDLFPLATNITWFARSQERKLLPFSGPVIQEIPIRGPTGFGQRFSFDIGSVLVGDLLLGATLQIRLDHWLDATTQNLYAAGKLTYTDPAQAWEWANSFGTAVIAKAELEIDGKTIEEIDGDFINTFSTLFPDYNTQFGIAYDHHGRRSIASLMAAGRKPRLWPTEDGIVHCMLPFFFGRARLREALPMIAVRDGLVRVHVTLRPFEELVRQMRGSRANCDATPLGAQTTTFTNTFTRPTSTWTSAPTSVAPPAIKAVQLITYGAILQGPYRSMMLRDPFEILHRELQTFYFEEPLKYAVAKRAEESVITIQLPLEANHPIEEIVWFVRRRGVRDNNSWTNYTSVLEAEWNAAAAARPLLQRAVVQMNGVTVSDADEQYYRSLIANHHRGGMAAFNSFIYGYPVARRPGEHQPSGSFNASRLNSLRLTLDVRPPGGVLDGNWEVKVFCIGINWLRFENGLANPMFED